jgi:hypothetical protein
MSTSSSPADLLQTVKNFIRALENRTDSTSFQHFYHPEIIQIEYPNTITKNTTSRTAQQLKEASVKGKTVLRKESYEIIKSYVYENTVIIEAIWRGILAIPIGKTPAGTEMKAYFAQFYEFKDGKIFRQRNYDCFEPFN